MLGNGKGHEEYVCLFLLNHPIQYLFVLLLLTAFPPQTWPHVNYFVNHHISFNCCGFVYLEVQIELGMIVGTLTNAYQLV